MSPAGTFFAGIGLLILFGWYFAAGSDRIRRVLGTVLTIAITAFCLASTYPPFDEKRPDGTIIRPGKIHLGLDSQGRRSIWSQRAHYYSAGNGSYPGPDSWS